MVRFALPFMVGIVLARWYALPWMWIAATWTLATVVVIRMLFWRVERPVRWRRGTAIVAWFLLSGATIHTLSRPEAHRSHFIHDIDRSGPWLVEVDAINGSSGRTLRLDATVKGRWKEGMLFERTGRVMATLLPRDTTQGLRPGDRLLMDAPLEPIDRIADPGGFDRRAWAASKGIAHEIFVSADEWKLLDHRPHWTDPFANARAQVDHWLRRSGLPDRERGLVKALVLGQRDEVDRDQNTAFARSGTIHVLAVSGMHVGLIYLLIGQLLRGMGASTGWRWLRTIIILLVLWGYAGLTGGSPSVLRATVMFTLFSLAQLRDRRPDQLNSLFSAGFLLLVWDPGMLVQASFQLSFLAVLGILLFLKPIQRLWQPRWWVLEQLWSLAAVSLAAQAFTTPVSILLFNAFPVWFLPANLVIVTAMTFAVYLSIALLVLHTVPVIGPLIAWALTELLTFVGHTADLFAWMPGAYPAIRLGGTGVLLLYAIILLGGAWWAWRWRWAGWGLAFSLMLILTGWVFQARETHAQRQFVVYDNRKVLDAAFVCGRSLIAVGTDTTEEFLRAKVDRHMRYAGSSAMTLIPLADLQRNTARTVDGTAYGAGVWVNDRMSVAFLTGDLRRPSRFAAPVDVVVIHDIQRMDTTALNGHLEQMGHLVLAGGMRWRHRAQWRSWAMAHGIPVHSVQDDGAFILRP
ncbi:MAG TPA: ComEC/Rec2 family competence protein [Flavobacteriales bacterium]|jgi:competence protein ComEC|nr:ComEC/Rec2 family competence protein [Flavobacteriales bacterium]